MSLVERKEKIDFIFGWIKVIYPMIILGLILLDYTVFTQYFGFEKGLFFSLFTSFDLFSFSTIILFLILPFIFIGLFVYASIFSFEFSIDKNYLKFENQQEEHKCENFLKKYILNKSNFIFMVSNVVFSSVLIGIYYLIPNSFLFFILFLMFNIGQLIMINYFEKQISEILVLRYTFLSLLLMAISVFCIKSLDNNYALCLFIFLLFWLISYSIMYVYSELRNNSKPVKNYIKLVLFIFFSLFISFLINNSNIVEWKKGINKNNEMTFNLLFNKAFLIKNSLDTKVVIPSRYYKSEIENIKKEESKFIRVINDDLNGNINYEYLLLCDYYYINLSSNIKIYFKELDKTQNKKDYRILIIEEKKFANSIGSEYILVSMKEI